MHVLYASDGVIDAYLIKALREAGHLVEAPGDPADGLEMASGGAFDAVVLDWSSSAFEAAARFAAAASSAFVMVVLPESREGDRAALLQAGADACFVRPLSFIELEERLRALQRLVERAGAASVDRLIEMIPAAQAIRLSGREIGLSRQEYRVLAVLAAHVNEVVGFEQLQQQAWGDDAEPRLDLVKACLSRIRRKLAAAGAGQALKLVSGYGYRLSA